MRIVLVNWAKIWDGAGVGGGVNGYCQALGLTLTTLGHDVIYLSAGTAYLPSSIPLTLDHGTLLPPGPPDLRRHPDWMGIRVFEVINSPVIAPCELQLLEPDAEVSSPALEAVVGRFFAMLRPDVVHWHNLEGFSAGCVRASRDAGARAVYSIHNYHTVCPQGYLMREHRKPCFDFDAGHACVGCIPTPDPALERSRLATAAARAQAATAMPPIDTPPSEPDPEPRPVLAALGRELRSLIRPSPRRTSPPPTPRPAAIAPTLPGAPAASQADLDRALPAGVDDRGQTPVLSGRHTPPQLPGVGHWEWEPLSNAATAEPPARREPNAYGRRRAAMIAMLNGCDRVLAVSRFVRDKYIALGVDPRVIAVDHIGTGLNATARKFADLIFDPPPFNEANPRPIRLVFMGFNSYYKGLHMLADTFELLTPEYTSRFHLFIYAKDGQHLEWRFRRMEPRLGGLTMHHGYQPWDVPWMLGGKDALIVTSVWWDNAPQTVFEAQACGLPVIGAELGGIPDFVRHRHNGLLFRGNDRFDLARRLVELAKDPGALFAFRRNVRPPKDIADHARELLAIYDGLLPARGGTPADPALPGPTP